MTTDNFIQEAAKRIREAHKKGQLPETKNEVLDGFSGESLIGALQRLTRLALQQSDNCYLEIGVFQGLTLLSVSLANPDTSCFGIDNFSLFDEKGDNLDIINKRKEKLGVKNTHIINLDFEEALERLNEHTAGKRVGVLFIDGAHDYRSQLVALLKAKPYLADNALIVVDDSNYSHVRQANADFLSSHPDFALLFEAYTPSHPVHMSPSVKEGALKGWWNGINIMVRDEEKSIPRAFPPTGSKERFFASHDVFRHEFAEIAIALLHYGSILADGDRPEEEEEQKKHLRGRLLSERKKHPDRFPFQNTESAELPDFKLHA